MSAHGKAQAVRVLDVFFIGPLMSYGGYRMAQSGEPALGATLALLGFGTVVYNGRNYFRIRSGMARLA